MLTGLLCSLHYRRVELLLVVFTLTIYAGSVVLVAARLGGIDGTLVRYAIAFVAAQAVIQGTMIAGLVMSKQIRSRREAAQAVRRRKFEELLAEPQGCGELQEMAARWPRDFLTVAEHALRTQTGCIRGHVAGLLEASAAYRRLLLQAGASSPATAVRALDLLGLLETGEARAAVERALNHPVESVRRAARKAVVTAGEEPARRRLLEGLTVLPYWERIMLFQLFPLDFIVQDWLAKSLASADEERILVALEFVLTRQRLLTLPVPVTLAQSRNVEIRIQFFRALPFLRLRQDAVALLETGLGDSDWRVRALAARACGYLGAEGLGRRLLKMCAAFENPAEAGHAARALSALGGDAWSRLQHAVGSGDGHRMAAEVMQPRIAGGREAHP